MKLDNNTAWEAIERLKARGYTLTIFVYGIGIQVRLESGGAVILRKEARTFSEAIELVVEAVSSDASE